MPTKQGKNQQDHNRPHHRDWPRIRQKVASTQGKNAKRTNGSIFTQPQSRKQNNVGDVRLPKHINAGHLIYLRFMKHKMLDFRLRKALKAQECWKFRGICTKYKKGWDLEGEKPGILVVFMKHKNAGNLMSVKFRKHKNAGNFRMSGLMKVPKTQKKPERGCLPPS